MRHTPLLTERYARAAEILPQKLAPRLKGILLDGYWLDQRHFFYTVTQAQTAGRVVRTPMLADAVLGTTGPVIEYQTVVELLSRCVAGKDVDLSMATYDMLDPLTLVVTLSSTAYHLALDGPSLIGVETLDATASLFSPDRNHACFLKDHTVWVKNLRTGRIAQLFPDGEPLNTYGYPPESGPAPLSTRRAVIPQGLWSADSQWFVTHRIDERGLPDGALVEHAPAGGSVQKLHTFKVAQPDDELPRVVFVAVHVASGRILSAAGRPTPLHAFSPFFFRSCWFAGDHLYYLDYDRFCARVGLVELNLQSGALRTVLEEESPSGWLDLHPLIGGQPIVRVLRHFNEVIWYSERDGHGHLYRYDLATGALKNRITGGDWMVRDIVHVDEQARQIYFLANGTGETADPARRRLCTVSLEGGRSR